MAKRLTILCGVMLLLAVLSQMLLPAAISETAAAAAAALLHTEKVEARVEKFPALMMLGGRFDRIAVKAKDAQADQIIVEEMELELNHVRVDMVHLLRERRLIVQSAQDILFRGVIAERELAALINQKVKGAKNAEARISAGKVQVKSEFSLGGVLRGTAEVQGRIIAANGKVMFKTDHFALDHAQLGKFGGAVFTDLVLLDLKKLPFDVTVKNVVMEEGRAVIYADHHPNVIQ